MTLSELSIRRHVLAWMLSGVIVLFGFIAWQRIGVDRFPAVDIPMVSVTTVQPGADPEVIASAITSIIEEKVNGVPGIEHLISYSLAGVSVVTAQFQLDKDIDVAFNEVQARVNQVLRQLPSGIDPPVVAKVEIGAEPVLWLALTGDRTLPWLNSYARHQIKPRLENIPGVGEVRIGGERKRTIRVWLDLDRMLGFGVDVGQVVAAFRRNHVQFPGGFLTGDAREYLLRLDMEFHSVDEIGRMIVADGAEGVVHLADIARIEDGMADFRQLARYNGKPAVAVGLVKVSGANVVALVEEAKRRLDEEILPALPPGVRLEIAYNDADIIRGIIDGLNEHLLESLLLATLVVLVFLRNLGATLIVSTAIPVSMLAAVAVAWFFGYTLNLLTLLAMLLLIGVVVDDAIVVLENIYRHREQGLAPDMRTAALNGSRQVSFAVIAASLTLVSIFAPVIFMEGMVGRFFKAFAVTVTFGVMASLLVALTLVPMLCSRYLRAGGGHGAMYARLGAWFAALDGAYRRMLGWVLSHRRATLGIAASLFAASLLLFGVIGKGFVPKEDEGRFMVLFKLPLGASIHETERKLDEIERLLASDPDVAGVFSTVGSGVLGRVDQGVALVRLRPKSERARRQWEIQAAVQRRLDAVPGVRAFAVKVPIVGGGQRGEPLQFSVTGPDLWEVARLSREMYARLARVPDIGKIDLDLQVELPRLSLRVDRERAAQLGLSAADVARVVSILVSGLDVADYDDAASAGRRDPIRIAAAEGELDHPVDLARIQLRTPMGGFVRLDTIAAWEQGVGPATVAKMDLRYAGMFFSAPVMPLGAAIAQVDDIARTLLPPGYRVVYAGQAAEFGKTARNMLFAFVVAMLLVFMVQASQFNSFAQPWVLILAQPMAVAGAIGLLVVTGQTLNIFSMIGLVLLVGLVAKNSILLVDLTNQLRAEGMGIDEALLRACPIRMRPVLMTSMTIVFAMIPTALGLGSGSEMTVPMAVAVIGG
ncbi:MAG: efflux RND transporter permease subunit, partial [Mariprofundaceae bacterium]